MKQSRRPALSPEAIYSNYFEVGVNALEFMIDFGQYHPEQLAAQRHTRIVTGPVFAKMLLRLLTDAVARHEADHGMITIPDEFDPLELVRASIEGLDLHQLRARGAPKRDYAPNHDQAAREPL